MTSHPPTASTRVRDRLAGDPAHADSVGARCLLKWNGIGIIDDETEALAACRGHGIEGDHQDIWGAGR